MVARTTAAQEPAPEAGQPPAGDPEAEWTEVVYRGGASLRIITKQEWEQAGIRDQDTVSWDRNHGLSRDHFTTAAIDVLRRDANFHFE